MLRDITILTRVESSQSSERDGSTGAARLVSSYEAWHVNRTEPSTVLILRVRAAARLDAAA